MQTVADVMREWEAELARERERVAASTDAVAREIGDIMLRFERERSDGDAT